MLLVSGNRRSVYRLPITDYRSPITDYRLPFRDFSQHPQPNLLRFFPVAQGWVQVFCQQSQTDARE
ncbi:MAG TPA: hypothetical protein ENJ93_01480 [Chloroflexi bacterium]|nr:hypothetical protein [Chloroflexota bacterium]